jgi:lipopolysaccharide transport system ATP-binding protein
VSERVLRVEGLSKQYTLGERREKYQTARDTIAAAIAKPFAWARRRRDEAAGADRTLWALKNVTFDVTRGEVVGVIGRNGAGKSTLLKVLSRITEPTSGYAEVTGRVGSLLEVGSGFHHELTGRENVFLNAAILGMTRREVQRKFDEIVEFAEVGKFIDTPVKHYSSGMHLRLAFSVAAHLEPEILLVDEVLAVGDAAFQKKCLGKMEDVATHGRTVLFVSHHLGVVKELCQTAIVMDGGQLAFRGPVLDGLALYSETMRQPPAFDEASGVAWRGVEINASHEPAVVEAGAAFSVDGWLSLGVPLADASIICIVEDTLGNTIVHHRSTAREHWECPLEPGLLRVSAQLPSLWLSPGAYTAYFKFLGRRASGATERTVSERVLIDVAGSRAGVSRAILAPRTEWSVRPASGEASVLAAAGAGDTA